ncbi:MAG: transcription elongation factor GreA [Patescibacteria group bacterium]
MPKNGTLVTSDGLKKLKEEFETLKNKRIPGVVEKLSKAREDGDLSENSGYQQAKEDLGFLQGRVQELEEILKNSSLVAVSSGKSGVVGVGCKVTVTINGKKDSFFVVGEWEANPIAKKISGNSPLGKALLGKKVGDKIEVTAPAGKVIYTISSIE